MHHGIYQIPPFTQDINKKSKRRRKLKEFGPNAREIIPRKDTTIRWTSTNVRESKTCLDSRLHSGFHLMHSGDQVLHPSLCQWTDLDSEFSSLVGFRIPWAVFWIPKPRIPGSTSKTFPKSRFHRPKFPRFQTSDSLTRSNEQWVQIPTVSFLGTWTAVAMSSHDSTASD